MVRPANTVDTVHVAGVDHVYRYVVVSGFPFTQCREAFCGDSTDPHEVGDVLARDVAQGRQGRPGGAAHPWVLRRTESFAGRAACNAGRKTEVGNPAARRSRQGGRSGNTVDPQAGLVVGAGHDGNGQAERRLDGAGRGEQRTLVRRGAAPGDQVPGLGVECNNYLKIQAKF